jgi:ATP-binding cassette subfamily G (WHITE) protein 2 (SNQ2)
VTKASTQCWDNSTKGLDASTAVEYVTSIRTLTNMDKISTLVALYQAGEQLYELFDKVILIDQGRCMYFGPTESAKTYFEHLGFYCPPRWTSADFLTSVTDPHERHVKPGWEDRIPRTAEEFENAFRNSDIAHANLRDIEAFENTLKHDSGTPIATKSTKTQNYKISFPRQVAACTSRQFKVMMGDPAVLYGKWVGLTFQSLIVGSLFYNLPQNAAGVFPRGGLLFFTLLFNALLAMAELSAAFSSRPILMKHKSFSFYRPSAHAIAQVALDIPFCLIQVSIWAIIIYFMADLQRTASQFFIFVFVSYTLSLSMNSFFRMLGAFTTSLDVATRMTGVAIQALVVYTGYLIPPSSMHPWFSWLRWINPVQYAFEALMANEFHNLNIKCVPPYLVPAGGPGVTPKHQSCLISGSSPGTTDVNGANYIWTQYRYTRVHLWRNVGIVIAFWAFFVVLNAIGLELLQPNIGGASVTVFKRGQTPEHVKQAMNKKLPTLVDEEVVEKDVAPLETSSPNRDVRTQVVKNDTVFTWQDVTYTINTKAGPRVLLNNIQGYVKPGRLTALMGESGAGKTTLLNTLAQRITLGTVQGTFLVDGKPLPLSFQRGTGFAEQQDVHEATMTVREALRFSALLRRPNTVPVQEKCDYVEQIIELLEMGNIAGATIGIPGSGLNQEQRKLVTIGVELASKPELLMFFDEPTSGLDSAAAFHIVRFLRTLADLGQIVLCTIHQPSAVLFEYFDELILLKRGGSMVYHGSLGPDSRTMIDYFEKNGGRRCRDGENPAEYMLDVIGAGDPNRKERNWAEVWNESPEYQQRQEELQHLIQERRASTRDSHEMDNSQYAMPWASQVTAVVSRTFVSYWRTPQYIIGMFMLHIFTGLFNSFTFFKLGSATIDMQSRMFSIFLTLTISPPLIQQLQPKYIGLRNLFIARENNSKIYHWSAFVIAAIVVEIPYRLVAGTLYFVSWYFPIDFPRDSFSVGYAWMLVIMFELYYLGFGQAIASMAPNDLFASLLVPIFFLFIISFCGVVVPPAALPKFWRSWMYHISPFTYLVEGLLGVLTHNVPVRCSENEFSKFTPPSNTTCQQYVGGFLQVAGGYVEQQGDECKFCRFKTGDEYAASLGVSYDHRWRAYGVFWAFVAGNFMLIFLFTWIYLYGGKRILGFVRRK